MSPRRFAKIALVPTTVVLTVVLSTLHANLEIINEPVLEHLDNLFLHFIVLR